MNAHDQVLEANHRLLRSIEEGDWEAYDGLCAQDLTCFEPESGGHLVKGLDFHAHYFQTGGHMGSHASTIVEPHVRLLGSDTAIVCYTRLVQREGRTQAFQETRVWQRTANGWKHVHFHRSSQP